MVNHPAPSGHRQTGLRGTTTVEIIVGIAVMLVALVAIGAMGALVSPEMYELPQRLARSARVAQAQMALDEVARGLSVAPWWLPEAIHVEPDLVEIRTPLQEATLEYREGELSIRAAGVLRRFRLGMEGGFEIESGSTAIQAAAPGGAPGVSQGPTVTAPFYRVELALTDERGTVYPLSLRIALPGAVAQTVDRGAGEP